MTLTFSPGSHTYRLDGKLVRSVTALIDQGLKKTALLKFPAMYLAEIVADDFYDRRKPEREKLYADLEKAADSGRLYEFLRYAPERYRDDKADQGTKIHQIAEKLVNGQPVQVPDELADHVNGLARWLSRFGVQPLLTEQSVASRTHNYAGRADTIATVQALGGAVATLDWKTTNHVYGSMALQLAAYSRAEFTVTDADPKTELPIPDVDMTVIVHITPDGTHAYPLGRDRTEIDEAFGDFLLVAQLARRMKRIDGIWNPKTRKAEGSYVGDALQPPPRWA